MSYALIDTNDLTTLGNAIRTKTGGNANLTISEMATAVADISGGGGSSWVPTGFGDIPSANISTDKYAAYIDLSGYNSPFVALFSMNDSQSFESKRTVVYYNGSQYIFLTDESDQNGASIESGVVTVPGSEPNTWTNYGQYYIIT